MTDQYIALLDTADSIINVDLYPARLRTAISDLSKALRETSVLLTESRTYALALEAELQHRAEKIEAVRALAAVRPKVKPLVWHEGDEPDEWKSGPYDVWREFDGYQLYHWSVVMGEPHKTAAAAQSAAQTYHEAHILSNLEPAVQPAHVNETPKSEDELVKALTAFATAGLYRVEQLTAERDRLREALTVISQFSATTSGGANVHAIWKMTERARAALKGGSHD